MLTGVADLLPEGGHATLEGEQTHGHPPAVPRLADHQGCFGAGVVEEHLVELGVAGELDDRPDLHTGLVERHQQEGQPGVPFGALFAAGDHEAPLRPVRQ